MHVEIRTTLRKTTTHPKRFYYKAAVLLHDEPNAEPMMDGVVLYSDWCRADDEETAIDLAGKIIYRRINEMQIPPSRRSLYKHLVLGEIIRHLATLSLPASPPLAVP